MPTWMEFGRKNPPKSALGRLLGRLVAVLGRLEPSWELLRRLEEASKNVAKKNAQKVSKKCVFRRLWPFWWGGILARARAGHARVMAAGFGPEP